MENIFKAFSSFSLSYDKELYAFMMTLFSKVSV